MKYLLIFMFFSPLQAHSFFGAEAESTKAYKMIEGALAGSVVIDDISAMSEGGIDYTELETMAVERSKTAARVKGESESAAAEYEKIKYMDQYNERSSKATKNLKRVSALYGTLCAFSPESCGVAAQHVGNKKIEKTNKTLQETQKDHNRRELKKEIEKAKEKERKIKTLKAINSYPTELFKKILGKGKK